MEHCVFCLIVQHKAPADVVYEDAFTLAFLDKYPQTPGHMQLIPKKHYRWVYEIPQVGEFFITASRIIRAIIPVLGADHATIATFGHQVEHAHVWIVPQYSKRVNLEEFSRRIDQNSSEQLVATLHQALKGGA